MSFKREGDDATLLGALRKRRIKELLSEEIPEGEAKLLCNGRFACLVCSSNPVFDTVNMLSVHRRGKKHLFNLEIHEAKKTELKALIAKRRHEQFLKDGTTSIKVAQESHSGILTTAHYDPRVKRTKGKKGDRKPVLDLNDDSGVDSFPSEVPRELEASEVRDLPGSSSHWREMCEHQMSGPIQHDHQLKNIFKHKTKDLVRVAPYQSKIRQSQCQFINSNKCHTSTLPSNDFQVSTNSASQSCNSSYQSSAASSVKQEVAQTYKMNVPQVSQNLSSIMPGSAGPKINLASTSSKPVTNSSSVSSPPVQVNKQASVGSGGIPKDAISTSAAGKTANPTRESQIAQKLRQLQGSGWKRDWDGKWIKDENAEFDSDEEPPDIP